ncbi:MAG: Fic family protein [Candidatus Kapabacteria bacterium]|jgi:fido (protein-threonine AMPylation protein)|nr:Fic family protein [Candidatus Kapabacteria bacterium]
MAQPAWYKRYEEYRDEALRYTKAIGNVQQGTLQDKEICAFAERSSVRLIFESNTIEKAGTKTEGETQAIIRRYATRFPDDADFTGIAEYFRTQLSQPPSIGFQGRIRTEQEVLQHKAALNFVSTIAARRKTPFLNEEQIFALHRLIGTGLMPDNAEVEAGMYRIHNVEIVGSDVLFPSAALVPSAMQRFFADANNRVSEVLSGLETDIVMVAAEISFRFVRIHPFPDFNGRMSRLLLAMTLRAFGVPFNLALRGSVAKYRNRYFYSLKRANHGDLKPYATLIAMCLVESFREIDENLRLAGQKTLLD